MWITGFNHNGMCTRIKARLHIHDCVNNELPRCKHSIVRRTIASLRERGIWLVTTRWVIAQITLVTCILRHLVYPVLGHTPLLRPHCCVFQPWIQNNHRSTTALPTTLPSPQGARQTSCGLLCF